MPKLVVPTRQKLQECFEKHGSLWVLPKVVQTQQRRQGLQYIWLVCQCGKGMWVRWSRVNLGHTKGCRSCRTPLRVHGKSMTYLYKAWHDLKKKNRPLVKQWQSFFVFERWAKKFAAPGWKLIRIDKELPYGPDNCDFVPIRRQAARAGDPAAYVDPNVLILPTGLPTGLPVGLSTGLPSGLPMGHSK